MTHVDVLIVTALKSEYVAARDAGTVRVANDFGISFWDEKDLDTPTPYLLGNYRRRGGGDLLIALARPTRMGANSTGPVVSSLVERLKPTCLAMCGVCAGNPADVALGDVIVAEMAYTYDEGKRTSDGFQGDHRQIPLTDAWVRGAQDLSVLDLPSFGEASENEARIWILERLYSGDDPNRHPARRRFLPGGKWVTEIRGLQNLRLIKREGPVLSLTDDGFSLIENLIYDDVDGPDKLPFAIFVGPIASSDVVVKDGVTWNHLAQWGVRTVVGLEMEAATIAQTAHRLAVPHWVVVKGVMDHADPRKDDRYKPFAARASAEVLFKLLAKQMPSTASTHGHRVGYTDEGDKVEWIPDDEFPEPAPSRLEHLIETYVAAGVFDVAQPKLEDLLQPTMDEIDAIASNVGLARGVPTGFVELDDVTNGLHPGQLIIVAAGPGVGKALALDTPLPTPHGWTTMGDIAVGDELLGADGQPTRVVAATDVMLGRPCYEIEFSDGTVIVADADHQWPTGYGVRTTAELRCGLDSIAAAESIARYAERRATATLMAPGPQLDAVRRVRSVPVRCVQVDNAAHLYLAGRGMVPTHNSTLGLDFVRSCSIRHRLASVIFSLEMSKSEIMMRLLSAEAKIRLSDMRSGRMSDDDWVRLARRMSEVSEAPLYIDDSPNLTMTYIRAKARRLRQNADLKLIVVDYLQLISPGNRFESRQQEVSEFPRKLKLLARELDLPVVAISQLNRGPEQRTDKKPMLADLGESGEQDSDLVILLHRPDAFEYDSRTGEADLIIAKHRSGATMTVTVAHQLHLSRFANMAR